MASEESLYVDRQGQPIDDVLRWAKLHSDFLGYRRLAYDVLPNGYQVSTVWEGIRYAGALFWTGVFPPGGHLIEQEGSQTEAEALATHARVCAEWREKPAP